MTSPFVEFQHVVHRSCIALTIWAAWRGGLATTFGVDLLPFSVGQRIDRIACARAGPADRISVATVAPKVTRPATEGPGTFFDSAPAGQLLAE